MYGIKNCTQGDLKNCRVGKAGFRNLPITHKDFDKFEMKAPRDAAIILIKPVEDFCTNFYSGLPLSG